MDPVDNANTHAVIHVRGIGALLVSAYWPECGSVTTILSMRYGLTRGLCMEDRCRSGREDLRGHLINLRL